MAYAAGSGAATTAAMAAIANAIKASGAIIRVEPDDFNRILANSTKPLVVVAKSGLFKPNFRYLSAYKGLIFYTKSATELMLPGDVEIISAKEIWIP